MYSKVRLSIKRRDRLLRFTINAHLQPNVGTLIGLNVILVSHLYDLPKKAFYERVNKDLSNPDINSKKWWSVVRRVCGRENSSSIPTIVENIRPIFDPKEKACILNDFFVFQTELAGANTISPVISPYQTQQFLSSFIATEEQVLQRIRGVDTSKVYGYDGVGNRIIKMCSDGFMSISLVLSICLFHLVSSPVSGSLQMLFLYSKMTTVNSK